MKQQKPALPGLDGDQLREHLSKLLENAYRA